MGGNAVPLDCSSLHGCQSFSGRARTVSHGCGAAAEQLVSRSSVCLFVFIPVCRLSPEMLAEPTGVCFSFFGLCFSPPLRYLMLCYLTGARGHQWGRSSAVAVRTLRRDVFTLSALAAPSDSRLLPVALFFFIFFARVSQKDQKKPKQ